MRPASKLSPASPFKAPVARRQADGVLQLRYGGVEILDAERLRAWEFRAPHPKAAAKPIATRCSPAVVPPGNGYTCAPG